MWTRRRLRWSGHVERKDDNDWVKRCITWEVEGIRLVVKTDSTKTKTKISSVKTKTKTISGKTKTKTEVFETKTKTSNGSMKQNAHSSRKNYCYQKLQRH